MGDLPYPEDDGRTHFTGCYRHARHHNCAVVEADRLRAINAELVEALETAEGYFHGFEFRSIARDAIRTALARAKGDSNG